MTKVFQILEEEKQEAINQAVNVAVNRTIEESKRQFAKSMLADGEDIAKIMKYTKLTYEEIEEIQKSMLVSY